MKLRETILSYLYKLKIKKIKLISPLETLEEIKKTISREERGGYLRFGDGDVFLMENRPDSFQNNNELLAKEMEEAFNCSGKGVHKGLAIHSRIFGFEKGMFPGNHMRNDDLSFQLYRKTKFFFKGEKIFSSIALHFVATQEPDIANSFLRTIKSKTKIFVGNEDVPKETLNLLFGNCHHIKTPPQNAYNQIERIEKETEQILKDEKNYLVVCVAMGCAGRVLIKRLLKKDYNVYFFDFGSLIDGIIGNKSRTWLKKMEVDYNKILRNLHEH